MHDTHLLEKIYNSLSELCDINLIVKIHVISIIVNKESHINERGLLGYLKDRDSSLVGDWTKICLERQESEKLTALITSVEGDQDE